jgi:integrating conjugative element protein (TIGR03765 family)
MMRVLVSAIAGMLAFPVWPADLPAMPVTVIHDAGGVSIASDPHGEASPAPRPVSPGPPAVTRAAVSFPVVSTRAGPGRLLQNPMPASLPGGPGQPIFIVGDDAPSQEWLQRNLQALHDMGARGIVAAVRSPADLERLRTATGLPMVPMPADDLLEAAGLLVWPVLIAADGSISQ